MTFLIILIVLAAVGLGWVFRVQLLSKVLGQPQERIARQLNRKKR